MSNSIKGIICMKYMRNLALANNAELLCTKWVTNTTKYSFKLESGQVVWMTCSRLVLHGWPKRTSDLSLSAESKRLIASRKKEHNEKQLNNLKMEAAKEGLTLLSTEFKSKKSSYLFKDKEGNEVSMSYGSIINPVGIKNMEYMRNLALANNAELLCKKWISITSMYSFKLGNGQIVWLCCTRLVLAGWPKDPTIPYIRKHLPIKVVRARRIEANNKRIEDLKRIASQEGFTLISHNFELTSSIRVLKDTNFLFEDKNGNNVTRTYRSFIPDWRDRAEILHGKKGGFHTSMAESICRQTMNHLLKTTFSMSRQVLTKKILNRSHNLELDGYCDKLKVAFEYQGYPSHWNKNHPNYEVTAAKDLLKKETCKKLGITLVVIPPLKESKQWKPSYAIAEVSKHLKAAFKEDNRPLPPLPLTGLVLKFEAESEHDKMHLNIMYEQTKKEGLELLDSEWKGRDAHYRLRDAKGNEFTQGYKTIRRRWEWAKSLEVTDPIAFNRPINMKWSKAHKDTYGEKYLEEMRILAESNGCKLISTEYASGCDGKLEFENSMGVRFTTTKKFVREKGWPAKHCTLGTPGFELAQKLRTARNNNARSLLIAKKAKIQESATMH